jgi:ferredoxin
MARNLYVDENECTGCEFCVDSLPDVFKMKNNVSHVYNPAGADEDKIQEVIDNCPVECIHWKD